MNQNDDFIEFEQKKYFDENAYDCVVCHVQVSTTPSLERPIGLVCLASSSSVMSCRTNEKKENLDNTRKSTYLANELKRQALLNEIFTNESYKQPIYCKGGVYVKTCGHYMHLNCQEKDTCYFLCPVCKQYANILIPIRLNNNLALNEVNMNDEIDNNYVDEMLKTCYTMDIESIPSLQIYGEKKESSLCDRTIIESLYQLMPHYRLYLNPSLKFQKLPFVFFSDNDAVKFVISLIRTQLEVNNLQDIASKGSRLTRACFIPYFHILSLQCKSLCSSQYPHFRLWYMISRPIEIGGAGSSSEKKEVPVLLKDSISIFLLLVLNCPLQIDKITYQRIVNSVFNLFYIQNIVICVSQMNKEQRDSFKLKKTSEVKSFEDYVSFILSTIECLTKDNLFEMTGHLLSFNNKKEMMAYTENLCLPFLRVAGLLQGYLFDEGVPSLNDYFDTFVNILKIPYNRDSVHGLLCWFNEDSKELIKLWLQELSEASIGNEEQIRGLLSLGKHIYLEPELIELPYSYKDFIYKFKFNRNESIETDEPLDECICLICGSYIETNRNFTEHTDKYHFKCGIFMNVNTTVITICNGKKRLFMGSAYLDEYGENNIDEGNKELFLCAERYKQIEKLWITHSFKFDYSEKEDEEEDEDDDDDDNDDDIGD